jgi:hypothetical protein
MLPGGAGLGEIETTSSITGESLYINSLAECGSLQCNGNLSVGGVVSASAVTFSGNVGVTGTLTTNDIFINATHTIAGDGSGLFNLNDNTKLPLLGGTMVGALNMGSNAINSTGSIMASSFSGNGAALTSIGNAATATNVAYSGLTGAVPIWNQNTTGTASTALNVIGGGAGRVLYGSAVDTTAFTAVGTVGQVLTSQGAATPTWAPNSTTDATKVPLAGGTMTGVLNFTSGGTSYAQNYKRDYGFGWDNPILGTLTPDDNIQSVHDYIRINYANGPCTINLTNLTAATGFHQDNQRRITIVKKAMSLGDYVVTLNAPTGYFFYDAANNGTASTTIPLGRFSATYLIAINSGANVVDLVAYS